MDEFRRRLDTLAEGAEVFHVEMDDPAGNSYLQVRKYDCIFFLSRQPMQFSRFYARFDFRQ